ncbi:MAG: peptide deformylase [Aestuariivita sp.]|nr:peptide deformylase [Aestuariivita sp.]
MKLEIILHPDMRLKKKCMPVLNISDDLRSLAKNMLETMYAAPGIGLAAPQVGHLSRLIVLDCVKPGDRSPQPVIMFNPEIISKSDELNTYEEGCLSLPEQFAEIKRPAQVEVSWIDENGNDQEQEFNGLWATCLQHEIDHLDGTLFIDYLTLLKRKMITRKMQKFKRELARGENAS